MSHALRLGARSALLIGLTAGVAAGCAARQSSSPFIIRQGRGPIEIEGPALKPISREAVARAEQQALAERAKKPPAKMASSVEQRDAGLRTALQSLLRKPSAASHVSVAVAYQRLGVRDAAFEQYSQALVFDARNIDALDGRARIWRDWGVIAPALADAHRARYFAPQRADVMNTLGTILERAGECNGARKAYRDAIAIDDRAVWARRNLARLDVPETGCPSAITPVAPTRSQRTDDAGQ
jgi:Flp pilus assembly protein TadD